MRVTIHTAENVIYIDGKGKALNCEGLRGRQIASVWWDGKHGTIKFVNGTKTPSKIAKIDAPQPDGFSLQGLIDMARPFGKGSK
jgi:hypothetical protein